MAKTTRKKAHSRRVSRTLLDNLVGDLHNRITKLRCEVESIEAFIRPNEQHATIEHQTRSAILMLINSLHERILSVHGLSEIIVDRNEVARDGATAH